MNVWILIKSVQALQTLLILNSVGLAGVRKRFYPTGLQQHLILISAFRLLSSAKRTRLLSLLFLDNVNVKQE